MSSQVNRRDFLKFSSCSLAVVGTSFMSGTLSTLGAQPLKGSKKFVRTYCEMCSSRCQIEAKVVDDKNVFIQGNELSKGMGTSVCARGAAGHSQLYDPQRLVKPLIRVGQRGENKWRVASYEEAYDYIAENMDRIRKENGPESFIFSAKTGEHHTHMLSFSKAYGSPNMFSHLSSCPVTYKIAIPQTYGSGLKRDFGNAKYILNFGHNIFEGIVVPWAKKLAKVAASDSQKLVVLDPRFSVVAAKADEWYPVKAGTDLAFLLSLIHIWLRDGTYDKKFIEEFAMGLDELRENTKDTTPKWQENITGIKAEVAENVAKELWAAAPKCIIDWGHKTTTGPAEYQRTRAILSANALMGNLEKEGGLYFGKKAKTVNKVAGEKVAPTLGKPYSGIKSVKKRRIDYAGEAGDNIFVSGKHGVLMDIPKAVLSKKPYEVKGWFMIRTNPLITVANTKKIKEAMSKLDFIVACDVYMSESALMADVVLPEATYLERDEGIMDKSSKSPVYMIRNKVVEPINDTKSSNQIFRALAKKLNIDQNYKWKDIKQYRVQQAKGNTKLLEKLMIDGYATFDVPPLLYREEKYVSNFVKKFPKAQSKVGEDGLMSSMISKLKTPSGKIELFSQKVEDAFPGYGAAAKDDMDVSNNHPYILMSGKTAIHSNGHTQNIPFLNMLMSDNPVWVHPQTARKEGIKEGETIYLQNDIGKEKATVMITEGIRPDTLFVYMGFGRESEALKRTNGVGTNQSKLLPLTKGPVVSTMITNVGVRIVKA